MAPQVNKMKRDCYVRHQAYDPVLGWRFIPDIVRHFKVGPYEAAATIGPDGYRVVPGRPDRGERRVWVFGCSYTFGVILQDEETYCALLQARFPRWQIKNFGVSAYSTIQNLLQLEAELTVEAPDIVIFGYFSGHRHRNVGHPQIFVNQWKKHGHKPDWISSKFTPIASLDREGKLVFSKVYHPSDIEQLSETALQWKPSDLWMDMVTESVFRQALATVEAAGGHFYVALLGQEGPPGSNGGPLEERLRRAGLRIIDAVPRGSEEETTFAPHDAHPNAAANRYFAEKIGDAIAAAPPSSARERA